MKGGRRENREKWGRDWDWEVIVPHPKQKSGCATGHWTLF